MNRYPAKPIMDEMAKYGRYGDTMLVHMNPVEVAGIASLVPGGKLTTNPVTGQPEAFLPLIFGLAGGALGLGTLGTAALTGIGTAAVTGDLKRGLLAGVTSGLTAGIGEGLAEGLDVATEGVDAVAAGTDAADAVRGTLDLTDATAQLPLGDLSGVDPSVLNPNALQAGMGPPNTFAGQISGQLEATNDMLSTVGAGPDSLASQLEQTRRAVASTAPVAGTPADPTISQQLFGGAEDFVNRGIGSLGTSGQLVGAMTTEGVSQQMQTQQDFERQQRARREESEAKRMQAYDDLQGAYAMAQPGAQRGYSPYRSMMSRNTLPPMYAAQGGVVRMAEGGETEQNGTTTYDPAAVAAYLAQLQELGFSGINFNYMGQNINLADYDPSTTAAGGEETQAPVVDPADYAVTPTEAEAEALKIAARGNILGAGRQFALEQYYDRLNKANRAYMDATATADQAANPQAAINEQLALAGVPGFSVMGGMTQPGYGGLDPVTIQKNLRGGVSVAPPKDYMPGFEPEFDYFQEDPSRILTPDRSYRPTARRFFNYGEGYFDPLMEEEAYLEQLSDYYQKLGEYKPPEVTRPTETDSIEDDPDNVGDGDGIPTPEPTPEDEPLTRADINALYRELFGRDVKDAGAAYWLNEIKRGTISPDRLREALIAGAGPDDLAWYRANVLGEGGGEEPAGEPSGALSKSDIDALYQELFGRDATDAGANYWIGEVASGSISRDNLRNALIAGASKKDRKWYEANVLGLGGDDTTTDTTTTDTADATGAGASGFVGAASLREVDPYAWSKRSFFSGVKVDPSSKETLTAKEFQKIIAGQQGKYGKGSKMTYDPSVGAIYSTVPESMKGEFGDRGSVPFYADPRTLSDVQRVRFNQMSGGTRSRSFKEGDKTYKISAQQQALRIGNKQYLVNPDGSVTAYSVEDVKYDRGPRFPGMNKGGTVPLRSSMGGSEVSAGGIANVPTEFTATMPTEQEFNMVAAAVLGRLENPDAIIDMFVRKYGPEMFQQVRNTVLRSVAPQAQTEGMIRGQGSGMDDRVPGMIGDQQPVAVSPGEFIVPADVVSGLGDGSSDAGAEKLDQMMDRVRMARGGTTKQAPSINAEGIMPA